MRHRLILFVAAAGFVSLLAMPAALADWPSDPAVNLSVADRTGEQVQAKIAPTADGGCYVSWFDNAAGGYDVYLQRLDAAGNELWPHNGVLVANRSFSSTEDYGLDTDTAGNALLAFRDDRSGSTLITAAMIAPDGSAVWGATGVQLTGSGDDVYSPRVAGTTDGNMVVGWTSGSTTRLQKLCPTGAPVWRTPVVLSDTGDANYGLSDLHASDAGGVIVSWIRWGPMYYNPRHLMAQKVDAAGTLLWTTPGPHVVVFDADSLQFGNFPPFVADGSGGAVFSWYGVSPLQCYAQRVLADGTEAFGHNGVAVSTNTANVRVSPSASFNPATAETLVFWIEENSVQSQHGVSGQKLDVAGTRKWGATGKTLVPVGSNERSFVGNLQVGDGAMVFFIESSGFGNDVVYATRVDSDGNFVWPGNLVFACSLASDKLRLEGALSWGGDALLAWGDDRDDARDIYLQNVNPDGTLGGCTSLPADLDCDGDVDLTDFDALADCLDGPDVLPPGGCDDADLDTDGDVDLDDFAGFQEAFTGE